MRNAYPAPTDASELHAAALAKLHEADGCVGGALYQDAEALLERAIALLRQEPAQSTLLLTTLLLLGRAVEALDPHRALECYRRAQAAQPKSADANLQLGRALWKCAACEDQMHAAEIRLRSAINLSSQQEDTETCKDAKEMLARLLCQAGKRTEAHAFLCSLGYTHTFVPSLLTRARATLDPLLSGDGANTNSAPVAVFDSALGAEMLGFMQAALSPTSSFWNEPESNSDCVKLRCVEQWEDLAAVKATMASVARQVGRAGKG